VERRSRSYVEERQRAGLVEHRAVRMFEQWGLGDVLQGFPGEDFMEVRVNGQPQLLAESLPGQETTSKSVPQQALVRGLIAALLADGADLRFDVADVALHRLDGERALVTYAGQDGAYGLQLKLAASPVLARVAQRGDSARITTGAADVPAVLSSGASRP